MPFATLRLLGSAGLSAVLGAAIALSLSTACLAADAKVPAGLPQPPKAGSPGAARYLDNHIIVQTKPGIVPARTADGKWTFVARAIQPGTDGNRAAANQPGERAIADVLARRQATSITPALKVRPTNAALAARLGLDRYYLVQLAPQIDAAAAAAELAAFADTIQSAQLDGVGGIAEIPNDPSFDLQWNMHNHGQTGGTPDADIDAPECWNLHQGSTSIILAILDTGVQEDHPDLLDKVLRGWNVWDDNMDTSDSNGHGTHVAGIAAARGNDGLGVAGVNWNVTVLPVRCTATNGFGTEAAAANAVLWAVSNGADVVSMSLQFNGGTSLLQDTVAYAYESGVLPIAAAGNIAGYVYPGAFPKCMAVSATNHFDALWAGSNFGPQIDVAAPGEQVYSCWRLSGYAYSTGTSMAAPHVSGLACLIKSWNPALTVLQIERMLKVSADDKGVPGFDEHFGWGRINARRALELTLPTCPGNVNGDGNVNVNDLLAVINSWGACPVCAADIQPTGGDGQVNVNDLLKVINGWGPCP